MDDSKIIELFFERSEQAIIELSNKYGAICSKVADNILNNRLDSEECVNDAYLGVWNTIPPQRPNPLLSYVCRIVRNLALKKYHENTAQKRNSSLAFTSQGQKQGKTELFMVADPREMQENNVFQRFGQTNRN